MHLPSADVAEGLVNLPHVGRGLSLLPTLPERHLHVKQQERRLKLETASLLSFTLSWSTTPACSLGILVFGTFYLFFFIFTIPCFLCRK